MAKNTRQKKAPPAKTDALPPIIGVVADPHIGNHAKFGGEMRHGLNARARVTIETLRASIREAKRAGARAFYVAGDLFHNRRPEPAVIAAVQQVFHAEAQELPVILVPGNHDMLDASCIGGNTACAPLWRDATVVTSPTWFRHDDMAVLAVPFDGTRTMSEYLLETLATIGGPWKMPAEHESARAAVLVTHVGVWDKETAAPWMRKARDGMEAGCLLKAMAAADISQAFVGNYHQHERFGDKTSALVVQVGTLNPGGFGDEGLDHRGYMALTRGGGSAIELREIPGPRFVVIREGDTAPGPGPRTLYVRHEAAKEMMAAARQIFAGYEHRLPPALRPVESAPAGAAREELSEDAAIAAHVAAMDLEPAADRDKVLDLARGFWRKAS